MDKEALKNIIVDQRNLIEEKFKTEHIIERDGLIKCQKFLSSPNVLLISGLRRAGKSFFSHLLARKSKYAYINFDDERLIGIKAKDLNQIIECFYGLYNEFDFLLFDEIQNIAGWELFISRLREKYKIIITGSNANLLSSELADHLTGRFISFPLYPLSFEEYLRFNGASTAKESLYSTKERSKIYALFSKYMENGGIIEYYKFGKEYLRELFSSIITKDITARYKIKYPHQLEELALLLVNYFGSKVSNSKITNNLKIKSSHTTKEYIKYLGNAFLVFSLDKFSYKVKEQFSAFKKVYISDNGLINSLIFNFSENKGRLLENTVAIELKRRSLRENLEIFYWDDYNYECDFIIKKSKKIIAACQVCQELTINNREREINGLVGAMRQFRLKEGYILTDSMEEEIKAGKLNIKVVPVWKWILSKKIGA